MRALIGVVVAGVALGLPAAAAAANPTKLSINCTPSELSLGGTSSCLATVTDAGSIRSRKPPTGTVTFTTNRTGSFDPEDGCLLEESGAFSSRCTVTYTPTAIDGGWHTLLAAYGGDDGHGRATARSTLSVAPANDELDAATRLSVPATVTGTTDGATWGGDDPELCSDAYAPVWYSVRLAEDARIAARLTVRGRVDAVVAVFRQGRSTLDELGCELTDASGVAGVPFDAKRGMTYLIAVAAPWDAKAGGFTLETAIVPPVKFPGALLVHDADVRLDPLLRPGAAFSVRLRQGMTYRFAASARPSACVEVSLLQPSARSTVRAIDKSEGCSGYLVYTPGPRREALFQLVVSMPDGRALPVHVAFRQAGPDDLAPGLVLRNGHLRHGRLAAREADVVDVYRFRVRTRGDASLWLRGSVHSDLLLLDRKGKKLACGCNGGTGSVIVQRLDAGDYFAVVLGRPAGTGGYAISLRLRAPTTTALHVARAKTHANTFSAVAWVAPSGSTGVVSFELERFDPLTGWHFVRAIRRQLAGGTAQLTVSPTLGRWRLRGRYVGTITSSPSTSRWILLAVDDPG